MSSPPPAVRLRRPPACDPPYDDERHPEPWSLVTQPPLELPALAPDRQPGPPPRRQTRATRPPGQGPSPGQGASPPARVTATRFLHTCLEIVNGLRPAGHIRALASPLEASAIVSTLHHGSRRLRRARRDATDPRRERITLRRMRTCEPYPGIIEIAAVIGTPDRVWAAVFRLERRHARWRCTAAAIL